jgi:hypothetical protein
MFFEFFRFDRVPASDLPVKKSMNSGETVFEVVVNGAIDTCSDDKPNANPKQRKNDRQANEMPQ